MELDAFGFERFLKRDCDVSVFSSQDLTAAMNNRHAAAKAAEHLPEFEPDIAATEDDQVFGNFLQFHQRLIREVAGRVDSGDAWRSGPRSRVDENFIALEDFVSHLQLLRREKARHAPVEAQLRMLVDAALLAIAKTLHYRILARHNRGKIHAHAACIDAPFLRHCARSAPPGLKRSSSSSGCSPC